MQLPGTTACLMMVWPAQTTCQLHSIWLESSVQATTDCKHLASTPARVVQDLHCSAWPHWTALRQMLTQS